MKHFLAGFLPLMAGLAVAAAMVWALHNTREDYCRWAARDESTLTACEAAKNCKSTPKDWERFQRNAKECLTR